MLKRFYPSKESFLLDSVKDEDLYNYIFHGFILYKDKDGKEKYASCSFDSPLITILKTPEIEEIFRKKFTDKSNNAGLIRLAVKIKLILLYNNNTPIAWEKLRIELNKVEHRETLESFKVTIESLLNRMFPGFTL